MLVSAQIIVVLFGVVVALLSLWGMAFPDRLMKMVRGAIEQSWGMPFAVGARIVLGVALLIAAPASVFPVFFKVFGWLALIAAAALPFIGRQRLLPLFDWFQRLPNLMIRLWLIIGVLFGAVVLYGVWGGLGWTGA